MYNSSCEKKTEQLEMPQATKSYYVLKRCGYVVTAGMGSGGSDGYRNGRKDGSVPDKAYKIAKQVKERNGAPPPGYKGGGVYRNRPIKNGQKLPDGVNYREYDINPYLKGTNRGEERIVIGDDGSIWYTNDHYETFTRMD